MELENIERQKIIDSPNFTEFIERSAKIVERALFLGSKYDIFKDYSQSEQVEEK